MKIKFLSAVIVIEEFAPINQENINGWFSAKPCRVTGGPLVHFMSWWLCVCLRPGGTGGCHPWFYIPLFFFLIPSLSFAAEQGSWKTRTIHEAYCLSLSSWRTTRHIRNETFISHWRSARCKISLDWWDSDAHSLSVNWQRPFLWNTQGFYKYYHFLIVFSDVEEGGNQDL